VAKRRYPRVKTKAVRKNLFDVISVDWVQLLVVRAFRNNNYRLALADCALLPSREHPVCLAVCMQVLTR
jgi:hypothetical protein